MSTKLGKLEIREEDQGIYSELRQACKKMSAVDTFDHLRYELKILQNKASPELKEAISNIFSHKARPASAKEMLEDLAHIISVAQGTNTDMLGDGRKDVNPISDDEQKQLNIIANVAYDKVAQIEAKEQRSEGFMSELIGMISKPLQSLRASLVSIVEKTIG